MVLDYPRERCSLAIQAESDPSELGNARVYGIANEHMRTSSALRRSPLIHVTGEMRAISDSIHQGVIKSYSEQDNPITMLCYVGNQEKADARQVILHNRRNWSPRVSWREHFGALSLMVNGYVQVYATPEMEPIHYSVFGEGGVLLQSQHAHTVEKKYVWLIEDVRFNRFLRELAERSERQSKLIPSVLFREIFASICSTPALNLLLAIRDNRSISGSTSYLLALETVGFIKKGHGFYILTESGISYVESMMQEKQVGL